MVSKHSLVRFVLVALVIVAMLGVPIVAGAQAGNGITSPAEGATVSGTVDVKGNVGGPTFSKWQLDLLPGGDPNAAIFLSVGTNPGAITYALDTTMWPDGAHALRLRNVKADSNYDEYVVKFTIANKAPAKAAAAPAAKGMSSAPATAVAATRTTTTTATAAVAAAPVAAATPAPATANGISSPKAGSTIRGTVPVTGTATGPNFSKWQLDLLPGGNPNAAVFLAVGTTPGTVSYSFDTTAWPDGAHALRLRNVRTDSNYDEYTNPITITNKVAAPQAATAARPAAAATPVAATKATTATATAAVAAAPVAAASANGISNPKAGSTIRGTVPVTGTATGPNFSKWQLDLLPGGNPNAAVFLAVGTTPGTVSYSFDTTAWPDGAHALRLRNVRTDSNYDEYTNPITITNKVAAPAAGTR